MNHSTTQYPIAARHDIDDSNATRTATIEKIRLTIDRSLKQPVKWHANLFVLWFYRLVLQ